MKHKIHIKAGSDYMRGYMAAKQKYERAHAYWSVQKNVTDLMIKLQYSNCQHVFSRIVEEIELHCMFCPFCGAKMDSNPKI